MSSALYPTPTPLLPGSWTYWRRAGIQVPGSNPWPLTSPPVNSQIHVLSFVPLSITIITRILNLLASGWHTSTVLGSIPWPLTSPRKFPNPCPQLCTHSNTTITRILNTGVTLVWTLQSWGNIAAAAREKTHNAASRCASHMSTPLFPFLFISLADTVEGHLGKRGGQAWSFVRVWWWRTHGPWQMVFLFAFFANLSFGTWSSSWSCYHLADTHWSAAGANRLRLWI
jgi:hypothetical protein